MRRTPMRQTLLPSPKLVVMSRTPHGFRASSGMRGRLLAAGLGAVLVLCGALTSPTSASAAYNPSDYPSWSDVQAAKSSESATAAEVSSITAFIADLRDQAAVLTDAAIKRAAEADAAKTALDEATQRVSALEERTQAAHLKADLAKEQAGRLAAQLYRTGGSDATLNLLINGQESSDLLYRLGTMSQLTQQTSLLQAEAESTENRAASLATQAEQARTERASLATAAQSALSSAQAAQAEADAKVAAQERYSAQLYDQLASLKNSTAEVEKKYASGQEAKAAFDEQERQAQAAAESARQHNSSSGSSGGGVTLGDDEPTGARNSSAKTIGALGTYGGRGDGMSPGQAQNYARSVAGNFGWGQDQVDRCLIPLWNGESGWRWNALNSSSGAYGIPQALPASKMAVSGANYQTNAATQVNWGLSYIKSSYGSPCNAWATWNSRSPHWY